RLTQLPPIYTLLPYTTLFRSEFSYISGQAISSIRKSNWLYPTCCWIRRFCINYSGFRKSFFRHGRSYVKQGRTEEVNERNENKKTGIFSRLCTIDNHYFNRYRLWGHDCWVSS